MRVLVEGHALVRNDAGSYRVGVRLRMMSSPGGDDPLDIEHRAAPVLEDIAKATGCRTRLGAIVRGEVAYMESSRTRRRLPDSYRAPRSPCPRRRWNAFCLAFSPPGSARHLAEGGVPGSGVRWPAISAPFLK